MPRAIWSGAISFGLVSIPVKLFSAVNHRTVSFNQLDSETNTRIKYKRVNAEGDEVPYDRIVKGYEISKDTYVTVSDEELANLAPKASRMIDITDFVDGSAIDPVFYDSPYYLAPEELARKSYVLLCRAMEESNRVAIASFVMRTKQYLVAIRPVNGALMMSTMVYADEVVSPADIPGIDELGEITTTEAELALADQLIDSLSAPFEPERYQDNYRNQVLELIEAKAAGEAVPVGVAAGPDDSGVVDLLAALEASVNAAKEARKGGERTAVAVGASSDEAKPTAAKRVRSAGGGDGGGKPAAGGAKATKRATKAAGGGAAKATKTAGRKGKAAADDGADEALRAKSA